MPAGAIDLYQAMRAWCEAAVDFDKMAAHGFKTGRRHDDTCTHAARRAHGAEYVGPGIAMIASCSRSAAAARPHAGLLALLADPGFVFI